MFFLNIRKFLFISHLSCTDLPWWVLLSYDPVMQWIGRFIDPFAEQPFNPNFITLVVAILRPDQYLPDDQASLGRGEKSITVFNHESEKHLKGY